MRIGFQLRLERFPLIGGHFADSGLDLLDELRLFRLLVHGYFGVFRNRTNAGSVFVVEQWFSCSICLLVELAERITAIWFINTFNAMLERVRFCPSLPDPS